MLEQLDEQDSDGTTNHNTTIKCKHTGTCVHWSHNQTQTLWAEHCQWTVLSTVSGMCCTERVQQQCTAFMLTWGWRFVLRQAVVGMTISKLGDSLHVHTHTHTHYQIYFGFLTMCQKRKQKTIMWKETRGIGVFSAVCLNRSSKHFWQHYL